MSKYLIALVAMALVCVTAFGQTTPSPKRLAPNHTELEKIALASGAAGMYALGRSYQLGSGVPINYEQAVIWLQKAVDAGHPAAMTKLALMYGHGIGVQPDPGRKLALLERAAALGDPQGMSNYVVVSSNLASTFEPLSKEAVMMDRAIEAGDLFAIVWTRVSTDRSTPANRSLRQKARKAVEAHVEVGDLDGLEWVSNAYEARPDPEPLIGILQRYLPHAERAVEAGNSHAALQLAIAHFKLTQLNVESSRGQHMIWARKSAEMGNATAKYYLSVWPKN